jgi:Calcineurin-like phosphoesterase
MLGKPVRSSSGRLPRVAVFLIATVVMVSVPVIGGPASNGPQDPDLLHPYLQLAGPGAAPTVIWTSEDLSAGVLTLSRAGSIEAEIELPEPACRHVVPLENLRPDTEYGYSTVSGSRRSSEHVFRTLPERLPDGTSASFPFVVYGDNRSHPDRHIAVIARILQGPIPSLVISTGDLVYCGSDRERWHREFLNPAESLFARSPIVLSLGNHDLDRDAPKPWPLAPFWLENFAFPGHEDEPGYGRWFSFDAGGVHCIVLDSTDPRNEAQFHWLREDLASPESREADFRIGIFHYPPYSAGGHDSRESLRRLWEPLLVEYEVDLVFNGHNHFYQRTWPTIGGEVIARAEAGEGADVILTGSAPIYVVTGGGGAPLYDPEQEDFVAVNAKRYHHVLLQYKPGSLHCRAVALNGETLDDFTLKHKN